ncbi:H+/Cl-antiporter ClcA [Oscillibacter sp. PC13]|uniref:chloride channel protein n=1 Tax=Oscillibacter sp. PC13 TaxID=1855299 RepID=UPI0008EB320E|nr:chloride channel protein [Oscillibacter sp. PC13]SFP40009.1 H+/Cl-antiporter ClcA [Oscillibacter sp. PC13]
MGKERGKKFLDWVVHTKLYIQALAKWLLLAVVTGTCCGIIGSLFHIGVHKVTQLRAEHPWLLWCLPLAGLAIVAFYKLTGTEGQGTNDIIDEVHHGKGLSIGLLPAIFLGTVLTHLCGGSAGREGAALQMGGTIGYHAGRLCNLDDRDLRTATMAGMAAFFSALFGTPLGATMFAIMVISVGVFYHAALIPCLTASLVAFWVSLAMGVEPTRFTVAAPMLEAGMMTRVAILAALCALVSILFCNTIHFAEHQMQKHIPNPWVRVMAGGLAVVALTYLAGSTDYNGAGMEIVTAAIEQGVANPEAFLLKTLFTAVTLAAGFKGGEVVPSFFVGATFGCVVGPLLGIPAGFAAALGLAAVFCGATNCPMASTFLAIELFGDGGLLYLAVTCGISYMLSGYNGLYSSQTILYSKLKAQYINVRTNHHHAGALHAEPPAAVGTGSGGEQRR